MIRQAHTYLVGALSGVVVIGIAIAAFVVLVSAQVFHDLPIPALTSSDQKPAAVSPAKALNGSSDRAVATTGGVSAGTTQPNHTTANRNAAAGAQNSAPTSQPPAHQATTPTPTREETGPAEVVQTAPTVNAGSGDQGSSSGGGKTGGSRGSQPSSTSHSPSSSSSPGSVGGRNATSTSGSSGTSGSSSGSPTNTSGSSGGSTSTGNTGGGGGSTTTSPPPTPVTTAKPSEAITESVNNTVGTVDEATGGALSESGVSKVTEEVVNGVAGPESVVGKTVDGVGEVVGGLVNGHGQ
jgi:hypothetical protein